MPETLNVNCYGPPKELKIDIGNKLEVDGWKMGKEILADKIMMNGYTYQCGPVPSVKKVKFGRKNKVKIEGKVITVEYFPDYGIEFQMISLK